MYMYVNQLGADSGAIIAARLSATSSRIAFATLSSGLALVPACTTVGVDECVCTYALSTEDGKSVLEAEVGDVGRRRRPPL